MRRCEFGYTNCDYFNARGMKHLCIISRISTFYGSKKKVLYTRFLNILIFKVDTFMYKITYFNNQSKKQPGWPSG